MNDDVVGRFRENVNKKGTRLIGLWIPFELQIMNGYSHHKATHS